MICAMTPPRSPYNLIQEQVYDDPWKIFVACIFCNQTKRLTSEPIMWEFWRRWPTASDAATAQFEHVHELVKDLGLTKGRRYIVRVPAGAVLSKRVACPNSTTYEVVNRQTHWSFRLSPVLALVRRQLCSLPNTNDTTYQKVNIRSNIWLHFTKNFKIKPTGPANVIIYEKNLILGDTIHQTIDLRKTFANNKVGQLSNYFLSEQTTDVTDKVDEKILKINPTKPFKPNQEYYIQVASGVLLGAVCEDPWVGVADKTTIAWKTDGITNTQPTGVSAGTPFKREVAFEFDAPVVPGSGMLNIKDANGYVVAQISSSDPAVTYSS